MRFLNFKFSHPTLLVFVLAASFAGGAVENYTLIDKDQLKAEMTSPDVVIIDVRTAKDWDSADFKIQGAQRQSPTDAKDWMDRYPKEKTIVLYCA